ncbi:hypothetical protein HMPREF0733_10153 [Rothia dentocariosa ATCC 17931]|uniref:Uncharacterized protein n=1 Tax=Rothia dentocariosa (strain ATCC 17931 / CDC X599 / XDIA) TaxID=762948 RepID=E3H4Z2_ROTDC|nr:hypothetical protein HMPREF0733_10153 [Rothia dentocariosa ATCC 17931]
MSHSHQLSYGVPSISKPEDLMYVSSEETPLRHPEVFLMMPKFF